MRAEPSFREVWVGLIVHRARKRFTQVALVLMVAAAAWKLARGDLASGLIIAAVAVSTAASLPAAVGMAIGLWLRKRHGR